uniref:Uncharacterized protein n=1 Tax=Salix viminalis TaxID=40686 RepID=A0A6N2K2X7_SALVM
MAGKVLGRASQPSFTRGLFSSWRVESPLLSFPSKRQLIVALSLSVFVFNSLSSLIPFLYPENGENRAPDIQISLDKRYPWSHPLKAQPFLFRAQFLSVSKCLKLCL